MSNYSYPGYSHFRSSRGSRASLLDRRRKPVREPSTRTASSQPAARSSPCTTRQCAVIAPMRQGLHRRGAMPLAPCETRAGGHEQLRPTSSSGTILLGEERNPGERTTRQGAGATDPPTQSRHPKAASPSESSVPPMKAANSTLGACGPHPSSRQARSCLSNLPLVELRLESFWPRRSRLHPSFTCLARLGHYPAVTFQGAEIASGEPHH